MAENKSKFFVYILRCNDDTLYTGWTVDIKKRLSVHNNGKGAKYTRNRLPVFMEYVEEVNSKSEALSREIAIKKLSRKNKLLLINSTQNKKLELI
ncbi:MAG: GIY-YIG nuclease family protein [Eubacteriales bacterium]|nr:GIY-YIG nuclease family protein [Eubacteriales bacterium]MDY3332331.1 GIY-YIG nuclease family protein [Gallibacter sp.]